MPFIILFFVLPLIEIALFYEIGGAIGLLNTLGLCLLTAIIGGYLFRQQGLEKLWAFQNALDQGRLPVKEMFDGVCILVAGALLMTPGFATDALGFSLFFPPFRSFIAHQLAKSKNVSAGIYSASSGNFRARQENFSDPSDPYGDAIDVEAEHIDGDEEISSLEQNNDRD